MTETAPRATNSRKSFTRWAVAASGWVAALAMGVLDAPAKINSFFAETPKAVANVSNAMLLDKKLTGTWGLEGIVDLDDADAKYMAAPGGPIMLSMTVYDGKVSGEIWSRGLEESYVYTQVMLAGRKRGNVVEGFAYDVVGGTQSELARFQLMQDGRDGVLRFKVQWQGGGFFPVETTLFKLSDKPDQGMPDRSLSPGFIDIAKENTESKGKAAAK